jgi:anti-sigma regulatory factor (Ser/Thr protein kinase)
VSTTASPPRSTAEHLVQFYASDAELTERAVSFVLGGEDAVAILVATEPHRRAFVRRLAASGTDVAAAQAAGRLVVLDAQSTLDQFFDGNRSDPDRYDAVIGGLIRQAAATGREVRVYGEMVAVLWDAGLVNAALELEGLWNDLGQTLAFTLLCGYPTEAAQAGPDAISSVCAAHSAVAGRPTGQRHSAVTRSFERATSTPAAVRRLVESTLSRWGASAQLDDVTLVASELANNALLHTSSDLTLTLSSSAEHIRVAVADSSPALPSPGTPTARSQSGRGLHIIQALTTRWGFDARPGGKVVWAEVAR